MQHSFVWSGNYETVTRWYPYAAGRLKVMRQQKIVSDVSFPVPGVKVIINALARHIFIEATGGRFFIVEGETDKGGDFISRFSTSLIEVVDKGTVDETFNILAYGFLQSNITKDEELQLIASQVNENYLEYKSPVNLLSSRAQVGDAKRIALDFNRYYNQPIYNYSNVQEGYEIVDSDLMIAKYDKDLALSEAVVFKHTDTITQHHEDKEVRVPGVYKSFDFSFKAITPDQIAIGNHLSNTPAFYAWFGKNVTGLKSPAPISHSYQSCASVYKMNGMSMDKAISFDMANYYDFKIVEPEEIVDARYDFYNYFFAYYFLVKAGPVIAPSDTQATRDLTGFYNQRGFTDVIGGDYAEIDKFIEIYDDNSSAMFDFFVTRIAPFQEDYSAIFGQVFNLPKETLKRYDLFDLHLAFNAHQFGGILEFDTRVDSVISSETEIIIGGQLTGYMEYAVKDSELYYMTDITQANRLEENPASPNYDQEIPFEFTGINSQGETKSITGGEIRPFISKASRDRPEIRKPTLDLLFGGFLDNGNYINRVGTGAGNDQDNFIRVENSLGTVALLDTDLNITEARSVYSNVPVEDEGEVGVAFGEVTSLISTPDSIYSIMKSGRYQLSPDPIEFSVICQWAKDLKELKKYVIIGQPENYYLLNSVLFGEFIYVCGMNSINNKLHPVLIKLTLDLVIVQSITYVIPNQGFLNIGMFGFFSGIYFDDNSRRIIVSGYAVDGGKSAGAMVASINPDDLLKIVMRGTGGGNGFSQFDSPNVHEDEVIVVGMDNDVSTGIGASVAQFSSEYLGATGKVSGLDDLQLRGINVEPVELIPSVSSEGLASLYATDRVKRIVKEAFYTAQPVNLNSVGGTF